MIRFDHVSKRYPNGREAVSDLSLSIARGEMVFLTGHSGAGKSTFLKLITAIERSTRGQLIVNGEVRVDGEVELRKTAKIRAGRVVQLGEASVRVSAPVERAS